MLHARIPHCQLFLLTALLLALPGVLAAEDAKKPPPPAKQQLTFEADVAPILQIRCLKCHGGKAKKGGLDLRRKFTTLEGGESGPAIVPGKPAESLLIEMIVEGEMPPKDEGRLDKKQIAILTRWVEQGAAIAGKKEKPLEIAENESAATEEDRKFWSFQPPVRPNVPSVKSPGRVRTPIDSFLLAKLEEQGGTFNPTATKEVLIRRLYFDLHGLPPTPKEIDEFLADSRADAYEQLVDKLLESPRYGERWARHWLDVAGYADSDGYLAADRLRPEAWRYRDYVIRALNADKPFDQFVMEQIAGDELHDWRRAKRLTPEMSDSLVATGFLRTALDPTYGGYKEPLECYKVMADTMQIVSSAFLGLTLQCSRCHAHKSDPISHRDYYNMHAIFLSSYDPQNWITSLSRAIPLATEAEQKRITTGNAQLAARVTQLDAQITALTKRFQQRLLEETLPKLDDATRAKILAALLVDAKTRNDEQKKIIAEHAAKLTVAEKDLSVRFPEFKTDLAKLRAAVAAENSLKKSIVQLRGLADIGDKPRQGHLLLRGDWNTPGKPVEPGIPDVLAPAGFEIKPQPGYKTTGRRKAFAQWLADPQNPLVARVHVNRIWAQHFGKGIVESLDNFGHLGAKPTHPELLDWLATEFLSRGWSQKAMHRLMLNSTAYRQSAQPNEPALTFDPANKLLGSWRPRRHEGEVVRDTMLYVAGKLNAKMYGRPISVKRNPDSSVTVDDTPQHNRRSVYLIVKRSQPVTMLELLDTPRMEINCPERSQSIVVTQALTMMNSKFVSESAKTFAQRILKESAAGRNAQLDLAYRTLFARTPTDTERTAITKFLDNVTSGKPAADQNQMQQEAWAQLAQVLLNSNEFLFVH